MAKSKTTKEAPLEQKRRARQAPPVPPVVTQAEERIIPSPSNEVVREVPEWVPVLALRDVVIYPYMIFPVLVGRESSLSSVTAAIGRERYLFLVAQRDATQEEPKADELYQFGTLAKVVRIIRLPNGLMKVLVDGLDQAMVTEYGFVDGHIEAKVTVLRPHSLPVQELEALTRHASDLFKQYVKESRAVPQEVLMAFDNIPDPRRKLFYIAAHLTKDLESKQHILEITDLSLIHISE